MENQRTGSTNRINPDRFFHVMNQGWYIYTREGVQGPYDKRYDAETYLLSVVQEKLLNNNSQDSNDSWRM